MKGWVYKLESSILDCNEFYIGSTMNWNQRKDKHKSNCSNENSKDYNYPLYQYIRKTGSWSNWFMFAVEEVEIDSKEELHKLEQAYIDELKPTLNSQRAFRTVEQRIDYQKEYDKEHYQNNKEQKKDYREKNKEKIKEYQKDYQKEYREKHREEINKKSKEKYSVKIDCECGGKYTHRHKSQHFKTKLHLKYMSSINEH